jgi:hypothetical protein
MMESYRQMAELIMTNDKEPEMKTGYGEVERKVRFPLPHNHHEVSAPQHECVSCCHQQEESLEVAAAVRGNRLNRLPQNSHNRSAGGDENSRKSLKGMEPMSGVEPLTY